MIPCPYCDREFEKRAGLMRHVTSSHPSEGAVPTNPGGAIEPVVPVNPEVYPPSSDADLVVAGVEAVTDEQASSVFAGAIAQLKQHAALQDLADTALATTLGVPTRPQLTLIRALIRQGRTESEAWMTVVGHEPSPRPPQPVDGRPLRLQQVAFRVRNTEIDQIDASWLLRLAEIGAQAIGQLQHAVDSGLLPLSWAYDDANPVIERWNEAIA